jgi:hypothetical protein
MEQQKTEKESIVKSIATAYMVLFLHLGLVVVLGLSVFFFRGLVLYTPWLFLCGAGLIAGSGWAVARHMKRNRTSLREVLADPVFSGRSVEISLLGGIASLRLGRPGETAAPVESTVRYTERILEDPETQRVRELVELARLFEQNLISLDEYREAKRGLLKQ